MIVERDVLRAAVVGFFAAVDNNDLETVMSYFSDDALLTVETADVKVVGRAELERMFTDSMARTTAASHVVTHVAVDETARSVATEFDYSGAFTDGTSVVMHNCNFFEIDAEGKFARVAIWMTGPSPLR